MPSRTLTVLLAAAVLVGGANLAAYAATGDPLLLGRDNGAGRTTTVDNNGSGPALRLESGAGSPPLAVSSSKKVTRLNADRVDGLNGKALQTAGWRYKIPTSGPYTSAVDVQFPGLPAGHWLVSYSVISAISGAGPVCYLRQANGTRPGQGLSWAIEHGPLSSNNGSALVSTLGAAGPLTLVCDATSFSFYSGAGDVESTVAFTRVDSVQKAHISLPAPARVPHAAGGRVTR